MSGRDATILFLSLPLAALLIFSSYTGLYSKDFYFGATENWIAQTIGQDIIDLFLITPLLVITALGSAKGNRVSFLFWGGVNLYLIYTFVMYSFNVRYNPLFLIYCLILGLSFYSFLYFLYIKINEPVQVEIFGKALVKVMASYFIIISFIFYLLWLSEILFSVIRHQVPESITQTGLFTNPVHVLDLSVVLPGLFLTGILLLMKKSKVLFLAPTLMFFLILMDITIGGLVFVMKRKGIEAGYTQIVIMGCLALFTTVLLIWYLKTAETLAKTSFSGGLG